MATLAGGVVALVIDLILYQALENTVSRPILIALMAVLLAFVMCAVITVVVMAANATQDEFLFLNGRGSIIAGLAVCLVVLFGLTSLFEWIYDHEGIGVAGASSYIFVLDESGSMTTNDPDYQRYDAVNVVVEAIPGNTPYAVYMFSDNCVRIRDMGEESLGSVIRPADADTTMMGNTAINNALSTVLRDIQDGLPVGGRPQVILLTDGHAGDMWFLFGKSVLKDYKKAGITVSPVGLGQQVDEALLQEIADETGGQYIGVSDATLLAEGFANAARVETKRDLISARNVVEWNGLYCFLRILFLTLIGAALAFMKAMACADENSTIMLIIEGTVAGLVGALIMEFGLALGIPTLICRAVYWLLLAVTPRLVEERVFAAVSGRTVSSASDFMVNSGTVRW